MNILAVQQGGTGGPRRKRHAAWLAAAAVGVVLHSMPAWAQSGKADTRSSQSQTFQDWRFECEPQTKRCYVFQQTNLKKTGQRILGVVVGNLGPNGKQILHLTVPLGIYIPPGVAIKIDKGKQLDIPVYTCTPKGCEAMMDLAAPLLAALRGGKTAHVAFLDAVTRRQITVGVPLAGFTDAYAALRQALSAK